MLTLLLCAGVQKTYAQDDILDAIEAELKAEEEKKKAAAKAAKNEEKYKANYQASIRKGDALIRSKKYDDAISEFEEAKKWGPLETYPDEQIALAKQEKKKQEEAEKKAKIEAEYQEAIKIADGLFDAKKYNQSIPEYEKAKKIDPTMAYPTDQIAEAKKLQAQLEAERAKAEAAKKLEEDFKAAIDEGDAALKDEAYDKAIASYEVAKKLKPTDPVPKARIETAKKTKADAEARAAQEKIQKEFDAAMEKANELLAAKSFDDAIAGYKAAQKIKPTDPAPKAKITEAETKKKQEAEASTKAKYDALVSEADDLLKDSQFDKAKEKYSEASAVLPHETYPKTKIKECEELKVAAANAELKRQYDELVKAADGLLEKENFDIAKSKYQEALALMPHETHPKTMIAEADTRKKAKAQNEIKSQYDAIVKEADALVKAEQFDDAIVKYNEAKKILPSETHPGDMLTEIEKLKKQKANQELQAKYEAQLKVGEELMHEEKFTEAIAAFEEAHKIFPTENKTTELIAESKNLMEQKKTQSLRAEYDKKIAEGEELLKSENFEGAIALFSEAAAIIPTDNKAKGLIEEAKREQQAKEQAEINAKYASLVKEGDAALASSDFVTARLKYNEAATINKHEKNTIDAKLAEVGKREQEKMQAEMAEAAEAEKQSKYEGLIAEANNKTSSGDYSGAMASLNQALSIFPDNTEALTLKSKIEGLIAEKQEKDAEAAAAAKQEAEKAAKEEQVKQLVADAKQEAANKNYSIALAKINNALNVDNTSEAAKAAKLEIEAAQVAFEKEKEQNAAAAAAAELERKEKEAKITSLLSTGGQALSENRFEEAEQAFNEVLAIDASNEVAKSKLTELTNKKDELKLAADKAAQEEADKLKAAENRKKVETLIAAGTSALSQGEYDNAIGSFNAALDIDPSNQTAKLKIDEAKAKQLKEQSDLKAAAEAEAAKRAAEQLAQENAAKQEKIDELQKSALELEGAKDFEGAKSKYNELLVLAPSNAMAKSKIAELDKKIAAIKKQEEDKLAAANAERDRKKAEAQEKERNRKIASQIAIGDQMTANKNYGDAIEAYRAALEIDPQNSLAKTKISDVTDLIKMEEEKRAKMNAQERKAEIEAELIEAKTLVAKKEYKQAKNKFDKVLSIDKNNAAAENGIAAIQSQLDALAEIEARNSANKEAELRKAQQVEQILDEGFDLFAGGKYNEAISKFKEGVDLDPTNTEIKQAIHETLEQQERLRLIMLAKKSNKPRPQPKFNTENISKAGRTDKRKYQNELGKAYPEGVTETEKLEERKKITTRIVVKQKVGSEYKRISYDWGGTYYFKNGESVGTYIWQYETRDPSAAN